ncbi:MAG TPA: hypothetical protein VGA86_11720 [Desulfatiglandales bacterium]
MTVHEGAFEACLQKKFFQFVKEDGLVGPGELLFFQQESLPLACRFQKRILFETGKLRI